MAGYLPPGCTQQMCDEAQPGYWDPPQTQVQCAECNGEGHFVQRIRVYEPGCGFPHDDTEEIKCEACNGDGWVVVDVEADDAGR